MQKIQTTIPSIVAFLAFTSVMATAQEKTDVKNDAGPKITRHEFTAKEKAANAKVRKRYADAILVDMLIPGSPQSYVDPTIVGFEAMADESIGTGFNYVSYSVCVDEWIDPTVVIEKIANGRKHWLAHPEKYLLVHNVDDILRAKKEGKLAVSFNFQGSNALGRNLDMIEIYYALGVRQIAFAYNVRNFMAEGAAVEPELDTGLSPMGKQMVEEMNRVGMLIDCTHASDQTAIDAAALSTKPIVMSHSNPKGVYDIKRNASDKAIRAVAKTGGVISINCMGSFLGEGGMDASPAMLAKHADYVKKLVGAMHVGFGSDHVADSVLVGAAALIASNPNAWPKSMGYGGDAQLSAPTIIWGVVRELETSYGWTNREVRGFLGKNAVRVYKANWKSAQ